MGAGEDGLEFLRRALSSLKVYQAENISRYTRLCMHDLELIRLPEQKSHLLWHFLGVAGSQKLGYDEHHIQPYVLSLRRLNPASEISKTGLSVPGRQITSALTKTA